MLNFGTRFDFPFLFFLFSFIHYSISFYIITCLYSSTFVGSEEVSLSPLILCSKDPPTFIGPSSGMTTFIFFFFSFFSPLSSPFLASLIPSPPLLSSYLLILEWRCLIFHLSISCGFFLKRDSSFCYPPFPSAILSLYLPSSPSFLSLIFFFLFFCLSFVSFLNIIF